MVTQWFTLKLNLEDIIAFESGSNQYNDSCCFFIVDATNLTETTATSLVDLIFKRVVKV